MWLQAVFGHLQIKKDFSSVEVEIVAFQFVPMASCPLLGTTDESSSIVFSPPPHRQMFFPTDKIPSPCPEPSLLQADQFQLAPPLTM